MVSRINTRTLINVAAWGAIITSGTGYYLQSKFAERYQNKDFYQEALQRLRQNPGAVHFLGEPITDRIFRVTDRNNNFCDEKTARFKVPVSGTKAKGSYYFWATNVDGNWKLDKGELELKDEPDKRLVIIKSEEADSKTEVMTTQEREQKSNKS